MNTTIAKYCKDYNLKFIEKTPNGFIASFKVPVYAGMKYDLNTGKIISSKLTKIHNKTVTYNFITHQDGDITYGKKILNITE